LIIWLLLNKKEAMRIRRIRVKKQYRLKVHIFLGLLIMLAIIFLPHSNRALMASYFTRKCRENQQVFSRKLSDRLVDYSSRAKSKGIEICNNESDLVKRMSTGKLVRVKGNRLYEIEDLSHSYPLLTRESRKLLREIGKRFRKRMNDEGLKGSKFIITSMTRTTEKIKKLGKSNGNASENSPHLYGNAFDISYARFRIRKYKVKECDEWFMKEALAEVIFQLRKEEKCWATYERQQGCFHVVSR